MVTSDAYNLTPAEYQAITDHAWSGETCPACTDLLQRIQQDDKGNAFIYPNSNQAQHMKDLFGYEAGVTPPTTGYLDPEDPAWQRSVEHIQERQKTPGGLGTFGPQSGMKRGEPTRDEWQVTSYLDSLGVVYTHKMKLEDIDPTEPRKKIEYDIFLPDYYIAIETSPGWHESGSSAGSFPQVLENDRYKRDFAQAHGIDLLTFDPVHGTEKFINTELVPRLRSVGVDAYEVTEGKNEEAYGKTSPVASCAIYGDIMLPEEYDDHMKKHTSDQKARYGVKEDPVHGWNEPMGGAPAYQEAEVCPVCGKPLVTYTDGYGETRCGRCNARLGYGKKEEERGSGLDQSQELPLFPTRGKVNTTTQTDEGFDKGLDVPNHLFHEEDHEYENDPANPGFCYYCGKRRNDKRYHPQKEEEEDFQHSIERELEKAGVDASLMPTAGSKDDITVDGQIGEISFSAVFHKNEDGTISMEADVAFEMSEAEFNQSNTWEDLSKDFRIDDIHNHDSWDTDISDQTHVHISTITSLLELPSVMGNLGTIAYNASFTSPSPQGEEKERLIWCGDCGGLMDDRPALNKHFTETGHSSAMEGTAEKYEEDHFNSGLAQVGPVGDFFIHKSQLHQGKGQESPMQTDYGYQEQITQPIGDSWKTKTKIIRCPNCGHEKELCDICNYHHHADNFMGEHEKFQMLVNVKSVDNLPEDMKEFGAKYGTLFPCPMDIAPEDLGAHQEEYPISDQRADKGNPYSKSPMLYRHAG